MPTIPLLYVRVCPYNTHQRSVLPSHGRVLSVFRCADHKARWLGSARGSAPVPSARGSAQIGLAASTRGAAVLLLEPAPSARGSAPIALAASPIPEPDDAAPALASALDGREAAVVATPNPSDQSAAGGHASTPKRYRAFPTTCVHLHTAATKARSRL